MKLGERIRFLREEVGMTQTALADAAGTTKQSIYKYETGIVTNIPSDKVEAIAVALQTTPAYLMGWEEPNAGNLPSNLMPMPKMNKIPLLGQIACGVPILAEENITDIIDLPEHINADFALRCKGDSMVGAGISDGDIVYAMLRPNARGTGVRGHRCNSRCNSSAHSAQRLLRETT